MGLSEVAIGDQDLTIDEFSAVISGQATLRVSSEALERTARGAAYVLERLRNETPTYGVNTGFGHASDRSVSPGEALALAQGLVRYHGCGTGVLLSANESRAVVVARLVSLARGYSAVRPAVLEALAALVNSEVYPCIPSEGSVGASGDLTPLSYVAALLQGERRAWFQGEIVSASEALERAGLAPLELQPKESLAIMNGTSVMGGLLALAWPRARRLSRLSAAVTAFACEVMGGVAAHFHPKIFELKAHPGTVRAARWIREGLQGASS
ncbi:MAG: aromatic amino acid ammonia-lyase, partial [Myxococcota bacterium]